MSVKTELLAFIQSLDGRVFSEWPMAMLETLRKIAEKPDVVDFRVAPFAAVRDFLAQSLKGKQTPAAYKIDIKAAVEKLTICIDEQRLLNACTKEATEESPATVKESLTDDPGLRAAVEAYVRSGLASSFPSDNEAARQLQTILDAHPPATSQSPLAMLEEMRGILTPMRNGWHCEYKVYGKWFVIYGDDPPSAIRAAYAEWVKAKEKKGGAE